MPGFSSSQVQSPTILRKNNGAENVGTSSGETVETRLVNAYHKAGSMFELLSVDGEQKPYIDMSAYRTDKVGGGGRFIYESSRAKSEHDGVTVISQTVPWDGSEGSAHFNFLNGTGETDAAGSGCFVRVNNERIDCRCFGIYPDGSTDWRGSGHLGIFLRFLRDSEITGVFVSGYYRTGLDNYYSNVSIYGESGAIFGGTIHVAINDDISVYSQNRPSNVSWRGECATYQRVGSYNCDDIFIEKIIVREDVTRDINGYKGGGIHIYSGSRNMTILDSYVEASERSFGLGVDFEPAHVAPESIHFGKVHIKKSYVHGVSLVGNNIRIDDLVLEEYGAGSVADPNINYGMPNNASSTVNAVGLAIDNSEYISLGKVYIGQDAANTSAATGVIVHSGEVESSSLVVRNAVTDGLKMNGGSLAVNQLDIRLSGNKGLVVSGGSVSANRIISSYNDQRGIELTSGSLDATTVNVNNNGLQGAYLSGGNVAINKLIASLNNTSVKSYNVYINAIQGSIETLQTSRSASGEGGGVEFVGSLSGLSVSQLNLTNEGDGTESLAGCLMNGCSGLVIGSGRMLGDDGADSFQPLRLINITDVSINGLVIEDEFNGSGVAAATLTNVGFSNCNNKTGATNISSASVSEFNCVDMAA